MTVHPLHAQHPPASAAISTQRAANAAEFGQQGEALRLLANLPKKDAKVTSALNSLRKAGSNQP